MTRSTACCKTADQPLMEDSGSFLATNDKPFCEALYRVSRFKENRLLVADLIAHFSTNLTPKAWLDVEVKPYVWSDLSIHLLPLRIGIFSGRQKKLVQLFTMPSRVAMAMAMASERHG